VALSIESRLLLGYDRRILEFPTLTRRVRIRYPDSSRVTGTRPPRTVLMENRNSSRARCPPAPSRADFFDRGLLTLEGVRRSDSVRSRIFECGPTGLADAAVSRLICTNSSSPKSPRIAYVMTHALALPCESPTAQRPDGANGPSPGIHQLLADHG
jgi:hypothetical protein